MVLGTHNVTTKHVALVYCPVGKPIHLYTNYRSLRNKIDLLRGKACVENSDIIAVTETWIDINSKNFLSEFKIEGYELFHEDRKGKRA